MSLSMFELIFDSTGENVTFSRRNGRIGFKLHTPIYFSPGTWQVAVSNLICNHAPAGRSTPAYDGAVYVESDLVHSKFLNGREHKVLHVANMNSKSGSPCICGSPKILSYCEIALTELSEFDMSFVLGNGDNLVLDSNFEFTIVLSFIKPQ